MTDRSLLHSPATVRARRRGVGRAASWRAFWAALALGLSVAPAAGVASKPGPPAGAATSTAATDADCLHAAADACYFGFDLPGDAGRMHYYASRNPAAGPAAAPGSVLLVMHGHPRDANRTFDAALAAARAAGRLGDTLVVAPLFQVPAARAARCSTPGVPPAAPGDALWTCGSWLQGGLSRGGTRPIGAFEALDALLAELQRQWPSLRTATLFGFSAGAQMLQHSIGLAADPPPGMRLRYVIADPGSWLYFDPVRPTPQLAGQAVDWPACGTGADFPGACGFEFAPPAASAACAGYDHWKYGTATWPAHLGRDATQARARYAAADISYVEAELDSGSQRGAAYAILDQSCAARLQGPFRLQRGVAYVAYDRALLAPGRARPFVTVPGCAHSVVCVLRSAAVRAAVFRD